MLRGHKWWKETKRSKQKREKEERIESRRRKRVGNGLKLINPRRPRATRALLLLNRSSTLPLALTLVPTVGRSAQVLISSPFAISSLHLPLPPSLPLPRLLPPPLLVRLLLFPLCRITLTTIFPPMVFIF